MPKQDPRNFSDLLRSVWDSGPASTPTPQPAPTPTPTAARTGFNRTHSNSSPAADEAQRWVEAAIATPAPTPGRGNPRAPIPFSRLTEVVGFPVTSGYRSQAEQDALVARGVTRATRSQHTVGSQDSPGAIDFAAGRDDVVEIQRRIRASGYPNAVAIFESGGRNQGTGAHVHVSLSGEGIRGRSAPNAGGSPVPNQNGRPQGNGADYERWLESALPPEVAASAGVSLPAGAAAVINAAPEKIAARQAGVEAALGATGERLDVVAAALEASQAQQLESRAAQVGDSRRINKEITSATQQLTRTVQPVMAARERIAGQLDELATMNPLERSLRGVFDLNYDQGHLTRQLEMFDQTLQARLYDYQYMDTLQGVALREIDRRYGIDTAMTQLDQDQAGEDLALVNQRLALASDMLGSAQTELQTQSQLIVAQREARSEILSRTDLPTLTTLMTQAQANGGQATLGGMTFDYSEIRQTAQRRESQDMMIRSQQLALANGEIGLADTIVTELARTATREQLEEAARTGMLFGVPVAADTVAQQLQVRREVAMGQASDVLNTMPTQMTLRSSAAALQSMNSLFQRTRGMFGSQDFAMTTQMLSEGTRITQEILAATQRGDPPEVIQALMGRMGEIQSQYREGVDSTILRVVGGDEQAAGYVQSFVSGTPMSPGTSTEALTYFALRGSLPDGLSVSPESRQVFARAQQIAANNRFDEDGDERNFAQLSTIVQRDLADYTATTVGTPRMLDALNSLPSHARATGSPLGRLNQTWWRNAYGDAQTYAVQEMATILETTPQIVSQMMRRMGPVDSTPVSQALWTRFQNQAGQYNALEQRYLVRELDEADPLEPGRSNSELLEEFLYSPEFHQRVNSTIETIEGNSFGDYIVGPMAQGAGQRALIDYAQTLGESSSAERVSTRTTARQNDRIWGTNGQARIMTILSTIPNVGDRGAERLRPFIQQTITSIPAQTTPGMAMPGIGTDQIRNQAQETAVFEALRTVRFDDSSMEAYRRAAIDNWVEYSQLGDSVVRNLNREARR